jgi:hypothetical protein
MLQNGVVCKWTPSWGHLYSHTLIYGTSLCAPKDFDLGNLLDVAQQPAQCGCLPRKGHKELPSTFNIDVPCLFPAPASSGCTQLLTLSPAFHWIPDITFPCWRRGKVVMQDTHDDFW